MFTQRLSARRDAARADPNHLEPARQHADVFKRFFDLIERMERRRAPDHAPAPETKARISRLDDTPRRHP